MLNQFVNEDSIYMSMISSYNLYIDAGEFINTISCNDALLVKHINSGEQYYCVKIKNLGFNYALTVWQKIILKPAGKNFFWPVDIINMVNDNASEDVFCLVFPCKYFPEVNALSELSKQNNYLGLEHSHIKSIVIELLKAFKSLHGCSYLYNIWDENNLFVSKNDDSLLIPFSEAMTVNADKKATKIGSDYYFTAYTDPYAYDNKYKYDLKSELYGLAAMLFRLLIGKYPYEGSLMDGIPKATPSEMLYWKKEYISHPIFIFDENDRRNSIGDFEHERIYLRRWNSLSIELKNMFTDVFNESNILRKKDNVVSFMSQDWEKELLEFDFKLK